MSNLFICATPLQLKIANKIIQQKKLKNENVDIIYYYWGYSKIKSKKIKLSKNKTHKIIKLKIKKRFPFYIFFLRQKLLNLKYKNVFIPTYIGRIGQLILNLILFKNLFFYSDGSLNIFDINTQEEMNRLGENKYKKFTYKLTDILFNFKSISYFKKLVNKEYTIYPKTNLRNYKYFYLKNFWKTKTKILKHHEKKQNKNKLLKIFIGTVYKEFYKNLKIKNNENIEKKINGFLINKKIDIYINHPREKRLKSDHNTKCLIIKSPAEDFILKKKLSYKRVHLYGICSSTTLFNLSFIKGIKTYMIVFFQNNYYEKTYTKLSKKFKINVIKLLI